MSQQYSQHPSLWRNNFLGFLLACLLVPVGIGIIVLLYWYLKCKSTKLEINGDEVMREEGLLSKERTELSVSSIRTVKISQSFFNRIFGVGTVSIFTAGDTPEIKAAGLPSPEVFKDLIKANQTSTS